MPLPLPSWPRMPLSWVFGPDDQVVTTVRNRKRLDRSRADTLAPLGTSGFSPACASMPAAARPRHLDRLHNARPLYFDPQRSLADGETIEPTIQPIDAAAATRGDPAKSETLAPLSAVALPWNRGNRRSPRPVSRVDGSRPARTGVQGVAWPVARRSRAFQAVFTGHPGSGDLSFPSFVLKSPKSAESTP